MSNDTGSISSKTISLRTYLSSSTVLAVYFVVCSIFSSRRPFLAHSTTYCKLSSFRLDKDITKNPHPYRQEPQTTPRPRRSFILFKGSIPKKKKKFYWVIVLWTQRNYEIIIVLLTVTNK